MSGKQGFDEARTPEFKVFDSIPRLKRACSISEKIDGTNAVVYVGDDGLVLAGSRSRWLNPEVKTEDNHGFGRWVKEHEDELRAGLGPGYHYGEWWGAGIQRRYGLSEKRWSLFNAGRWSDVRPACCHVVPVLYTGEFSTEAVNDVLAKLAAEGSRAAPGFMQPEGVVVYMASSRSLYKITLGDDGHKGKERLS